MNTLINPYANVHQRVVETEVLKEKHSQSYKQLATLLSRKLMVIGKANFIFKNLHSFDSSLLPSAEVGFQIFDKLFVGASVATNYNVYGFIGVCGDLTKSLRLNVVLCVGRGEEFHDVQACARFGFVFEDIIKVDVGVLTTTEAVKHFEPCQGKTTNVLLNAMKHCEGVSADTNPKGCDRKKIESYLQKLDADVVKLKNERQQFVDYHKLDENMKRKRASARLQLKDLESKSSYSLNTEDKPAVQKKDVAVAKHDEEEKFERNTSKSKSFRNIFKKKSKTKDVEAKVEKDDSDSASIKGMIDLSNNTDSGVDMHDLSPAEKSPSKQSIHMVDHEYSELSSNRTKLLQSMAASFNSKPNFSNLMDCHFAKAADLSDKLFSLNKALVEDYEKDTKNLVQLNTVTSNVRKLLVFVSFGINFTPVIRFIVGLNVY